jgi:acetyltransferase-like isoleucine patch superfamily enzyme
MSKEYQRVPPLHDLARNNEPETPHPGGHLPQINILHASRKNSPTQGGQQHSSTNPQVAAQLALSHPGFPGRRTQKEEMLSGRSYYPFDKELCLERERCASACWRFNNLTVPSHGVSHEERGRLFLDILQPRDPVRVSPTEASPVTNVGRVGREVAVETPFTCDYGYNITIGSHVAVGRNCHINDVCEVKIGDHCVIGPNVNIYTATMSTDPKRRMGGQGPQTGKPVVIEQDCWIGGGAIILPGKTIGKGATVGAGSVVTKVCDLLLFVATAQHALTIVARMCHLLPSWLETQQGFFEVSPLDLKALLQLYERMNERQRLSIYRDTPQGALERAVYQ